MLEARALDRAPLPRAGYEAQPAVDTADVLAVVGFASDPLPDAGLALRVGLERLSPAPVYEVWRAAGVVQREREDALRYAHDGAHLFGVIELDEREAGGIGAAAREAYRRIGELQRRAGYPAMLRLWNYFDAINQGHGDDERYRRFCVGRAEGMREGGLAGFPAATAIGRRDGDPRLQVYWLAAREPGTAVENPRQVSAYHYPRQYGPASPSFSRAMIADGRTLLISGTASVVGHATLHAGDVVEQLAETLRNLDALLDAARTREPGVASRLHAGSLLKVYLREPARLEDVTALLDRELPPATPRLILAGDICRADLLVEIDAVHGAAA